MRYRYVLAAAALAASVVTPRTLAAQSGPWAAAITTTVNPLAIGGCGPVRLTLTDPATKDWPRNASGNYVSLGDFDMSVTGVDPTGVVGEYNGPSIWSACACQGATVGSAATITATYPSQALAQKKRATGVAFQTTTTFTIAKARSSNDVAPCLALKNQTVASAGSVAPSIITSAPTVGTSGAPAVSIGGASPPGSLAAPVATTQPITVPKGVVSAGQPAPSAQPVPPAQPAPSSTNAVVPVNPSVLVGKELGPGEIRLTWKKVSGVSYYVVLGPGSTYGGVKVTDTTYTVTGAPAGKQQWLVGSYYDPGAISSPAQYFSKVNVQSWGPPQTNTYRVVATGFTVVKEQKDDVLSRDGMHNEVYASFSMFHFRAGVDYNLVDRDLKHTPVYGDVSKGGPNRVRAGSASTTGGLKTGDSFPSVPTLRVGPVNDQGFPFRVWEGSLTDALDFTIIVPQVWEWGGDPANYDAAFSDLVDKAPKMWLRRGQGFWPAFDPGVEIYEMGMGGPDVGAPAYGFTTGWVDRPVGVRPNPTSGGFFLPFYAFDLTRRDIETSISKLKPGSPPRIALAIPFDDDPNTPNTGGKYILYLEIERLP